MATHWLWFIIGAASVWSWGVFNIIPPHVAGIGVAMGASFGILMPGLVFTLIGAGIGRTFRAVHLGVYISGPIAIIGTVIFGMAYSQFMGAS